MKCYLREQVTSMGSLFDMRFLAGAVALWHQPLMGNWHDSSIHPLLHIG